MERPALSTLDFDALRKLLPDHVMVINSLWGLASRSTRINYVDPERLYYHAQKMIPRDRIELALDALVGARVLRKMVEIRCPDGGWSMNKSGNTPFFRVGGPLPKVLRSGSSDRLFNVENDGIEQIVYVTPKPKAPKEDE